MASLQAPQTAASIDEFTLTAQSAHLPFMPKGQDDAWTFNGTLPAMHKEAMGKWDEKLNLIARTMTLSLSSVIV